jgi:aldehyde dehydrogenase (NAD+)
MQYLERDLSRFYIDGEWVKPFAGSSLVDMIDPATESVSGRVAFGTQHDVDRAISAAAGAFSSFSRTTLPERLALLRRIIAAYEPRMVDFADAITTEMGAPYATLAITMQAPVGLWHFQTAAACLERYELDRLQGTTRLVREPVGVCGLISPWNWPINQTVCKVAPALAMGCTMVLKPSQHSSYSAQVLGEVLHEAGVPAGVFNLVYGEGRTLGETIAGHPALAMVSFTGSTSAGVRVAQRAAQTIKRVSLELGGKSANIILPDAPFAEAVTHGVRSMMGNCGQSCNAPSRMLVPHSQMEQAEALAVKACSQLVVGDPRDPKVQVGPLANERQYRKVIEMIDTGAREGAKLVTGGSERPSGLSRGYFVAPTVFSRVKRDMTIAREEIFGPVLSIMGYESEEEAIEIANDSIYGLSGYVFGPNIERAESVARRLRTGMVHLNGASIDIAAPFGGYSQSGNGREWGAFGLDEFAEVKAIMGAGSSG